MKRITRWVCLPAFLLLCVAVFLFLHTFTKMEDSMQFIEWESSSPEKEDSFRFTAQLPEELGNGYLLFETCGQELTLFLNGEEIYYSSAIQPEGTVNMSQAHVYLPENASGELSLVCRVLDDSNALFPPLFRFIPDGLTDTESMAYANLYGIPSGIAAFALLLVSGLFLLGIIRGKADWSLIPLAIASAGLMIYRICQSCGYYFLSEPVLSVFLWSGWRWITPLALVIYLAMNRRKDFWRHLGLASAWSAVALLVCYLISLADGGYLSRYINMSVSDLFQSGFYDGILYWLTFWLSAVCALISAYGVMNSFTRQQAEAQGLALKNKLMMDSYHAIEKKMHDSAALRHEFKHRLTALDLLYQKRDYDGIGTLLSELKQDDAKVSQTQFTENFSVNAILQDAVSRASETQVYFEVRARVPEELFLPENDLCILLMNMLDNALEACEKVENPKSRFIRFHIEAKNGFLAVQCENSYAGELKKDTKGRLSTAKEDSESHGFGLTQMSAIAKKYHSVLDISYQEDSHVFTVQTALKLPEN